MEHNKYMENVFVPYNDKWPEYFQNEKNKLINVLKNFDIQRIEHIGATSVLLCGTAGTIDVLISIPSSLDLFTISNFLNAHGYEYVEHKSTPNCQMLVRRNVKNEVIATFRVVEFASDTYNTIMSFKHYLKGLVENRRKYDEFRKTLLENKNIKYQEYQNRKVNYIKSHI